MMERVLAIETSCDDTSVAIVDRGGRVLSVVSASQDLEHQPYGGIVPEIASRNHSIALIPLIEEALKKANMTWADIPGIAVTSRPGLIGALIVGLVTAKSLSQAKNIPFIGVNHLEGHLLAPFLKDDQYSPPEDFDYPYVGLAISGGHTSLYHIRGIGDYEVLGATKDDAAGEAFDKFAKMAGLGFPGGVKVDQISKTGNPAAYDFPRSMIHDDTFDMSFSGLKSSGQRMLEQMGAEEVKKHLPDLCASFQEAIVDVLIAKLEKAAKKFKSKRVILTGGVSANSRLRARAEEWAQKKGYKLVIPPIRYCTDNAA
ncbi:MAG: tRNA (adenosine(37)-N6)-threonylcarbamoyltransferase complex transferase subunit TsaD, partial [Bdellovibrionaceae bacterium]|nr:tRNA (adenosine(37)-N6)-threonylcarbamoyltransferase complex transferase subunit TsaD [Pseudobdellovibrionaceae bacterium]